MDFYKTLFWFGVFILLTIHMQLVLNPESRQHAIIALTGLAMMFVGSKLGREFLGIRA